MAACGGCSPAQMGGGCWWVTACCSCNDHRLHGDAHALVLLQLKKNEKMPLLPVWVVDLDTNSWTSLATTGDIPTARGGHSVSTAVECRATCACSLLGNQLVHDVPAEVPQLFLHKTVAGSALQ